MSRSFLSPIYRLNTVKQSNDKFIRKRETLRIELLSHN